MSQISELPKPEKPHLLGPTPDPGLTMPSDLSASEAASDVVRLRQKTRRRYIPASPTLTLADFLRPPVEETVFPFTDQGAIYFHVARSSIYHLMRALGEAGATVLMPDYHSGCEVWAVRSAGASVRYYHIRRDLTPDLDEVRELSNSGCRVLYVIHYFGWPQPIREMLALCKERGMILIEDCALSLLSECAGRPLGTFGDYSIFCLYKSLAVPNGGMLIQNSGQPVDPRRLQRRRADGLSAFARLCELLFLNVRSRWDLCGRTMFAAKNNLGRILDYFGVVRLPVGDISPEFQSEGYKIENLTVQMSGLSNALLKRFDYRAIYRRRRQNYLRLQKRLNEFTFLNLAEGVCPLFFPVLVSDKTAAAEAFRQRGIEVMRFWDYGYPEARTQTGKDAQFLRNHLLELPIHQDMTAEQIDYVADEALKLKPFLL